MDPLYAESRIVVRMNEKIVLRTTRTSDLINKERAAIVALCNAAHQSDFNSLFIPLPPDGLHVMAFDANKSRVTPSSPCAACSQITCHSSKLHMWTRSLPNLLFSGNRNHLKTATACTLRIKYRTYRVFNSIKRPASIRRSFSFFSPTLSSNTLLRPSISPLR